MGRPIHVRTTTTPEQDFENTKKRQVSTAAYATGWTRPCLLSRRASTRYAAPCSYHFHARVKISRAVRSQKRRTHICSTRQGTQPWPTSDSSEAEQETSDFCRLDPLSRSVNSFSGGRPRPRTTNNLTQTDVTQPNRNQPNRNQMVLTNSGRLKTY